MSLAEDLLNDLDDLGELDHDLNEEEEDFKEDNLKEENDSMQEDQNDDEEDEEDSISLQAQRNSLLNSLLVNVSSIFKVCTLTQSHQYKDILSTIEQYSKVDSQRVSRGLPPKEIIGNLEDDPEYRIIVGGNDLLFSIDTEMLICHKVIYRTRLDISVFLLLSSTYT